MSKKSWSIWCSYLQYKKGQDFPDIKYIWRVEKSMGVPITMGLRLVASFSEEEDDVSDAVRLNCKDNGF